MRISGYLMVALLLIPIGVQAEEWVLRQHVLGSMGGHSTSGQEIVDFTVGEQVLGKSANDSLIATLGYWDWGSFPLETGVEEDLRPRYIFSLGQNYPNPFNPTTTIRFSLAGGKSIPVRICVYDVSGALVKTLIDEIKQPGQYQIVWNGTNDGGHVVASGIYFYRMRAGRFTETKKLLLLK